MELYPSPPSKTATRPNAFLSSSASAASSTSPPSHPPLSSSPSSAALFSKPPPVALPTGAVLVDPKDKVLALDRTGEAHAAVRCILSASGEVLGSDMYLSRFPCALCMRVMVQSGIKKVYYFPAKLWEMESEEAAGSPAEMERKNKNRRAVARLVANNSIAMTLFIPQWDHADIPEEDSEAEEDTTIFRLEEPHPGIPPIPASTDTIAGSFGSLSIKDSPVPKPPSAPHPPIQTPWKIDESIGTSTGIARRWDTIQSKFKRTCLAMQLLQEKYAVGVRCWTHRHPHHHQFHHHLRHLEMAKASDEHGRRKSSDLEIVPELPIWARHAMVLANIAARRTDDPKLGVGSVLIEDGRYVSVGWNGYPKKAHHLDYPQAGADDSVEDEELKYDYILHSEQNALLWRNPMGSRIKNGWLICTKMPCDECSPMLHDCGISKVVTVPQLPKSPDDPARLRGLTYDKVESLMDEVIVFNV
ncbi:Cytidine and dCMP deaminase domain-containing protein 1 [Phlyctochytrium planicorne]|nr:Cytidine and dCMP deaminase domain-containing protein 1 [Phlyctochytrium planicorne]